MKPSFSRNVSATLAGKVFYMLTRIGLPPLILSYVSIKEYGIWACCFVLIAYIGMSAFGVSNVYIKFVSQLEAEGKTEEINAVISTGLAITLAAAAIILPGVYAALPSIIPHFGIEPPLQETAFILFFGTAATILLDLTLGAFAYVLIGLQRIAEQTAIWAASFTLEAALIAGLLVYGWGVYALLMAFAARYVFSTIAYFIAAKIALPSLRVGPSHVRRDQLRHFYGYGAVVQVSGLLGMFLYSVEKLLAGLIVGVQATGILDVGQKLPVMASQIPSSMNGVFLPTFASLHARGEHEALARLYLQGSRTLSIMAGAGMGFLAAFAEPLLRCWLGEQDFLQQAALLMALFTLPYHLNIVTGPGSALHKATHRPSRELFYPLTQLALVAAFVGGGVALAEASLLAVCIGVAAAMSLSALAYNVYNNHLAGASQLGFAGLVLAPGLLPYGLGYGVEFALRDVAPLTGDRWEILGGLAIASGVYGIALVGCLLGLILSQEERGKILGKVGLAGGRA